MASSNRSSFIIAGVVIAIAAMIPWIVERNSSPRLPELQAATPQNSPAASTEPAPQECGIANIRIVSLDAGFVDSCRTRPCPSLKGVGVLHNGCPVPVGVQLQFTALDASGRPVATRELWPASTRNIPPGDYTFSLDTWADYDPRIKSFTAKAIDTRAW